MKFLFMIPFAVLLMSAESAQPSKRNDKVSNLALMMAYRPNTEIRTRDLNSNKEWTYTVEDQIDDEVINEELLKALIKEKLAARQGKKTVKRHQEPLSESESEEVSEIKIVNTTVAGRSGDANSTCYTNTYKAVLDAFEAALKSQISNYKKCVTENVPKTTTEVTTTTTESDITGRNLNDSDEEDSRVAIKNDPAVIQAALDKKDDVICFHRQYALMLNKLLERIPCKKASTLQSLNPTDSFTGEPVERAERNNQDEISASFESVEIDVAEVTPKPADDLEQKILAVLKEHLSSTQRPIENKPQKITIKPRKVEELPQEELSKNDFMKKLQELFQKYQPDESFPVEPTPSVSPRKSSNKSSTVTKAVDESSDESTAASIKIKKRKFEKEHLKPRENSRKLPQSRSNAIGESKRATTEASRKSYRTATRAHVTEDHSLEDDDVPRISITNHNNHASSNSKKSHRHGKNPRTSDDDRIASDLAKKISDFARGRLTTSQ